MVKTTFLNLDEEKRERILTAALKEFSTQPYENASLNRIVAQAGIPKGSLYQYFSDKKDLYFYLIDEAAQAKLTFLRQHGLPRDADFFEGFAALMLAGAEFDLNYPQYSRLLSQAFNSPLVDEITARLKGKSFDYLYELLQTARQQGHIRSDLPLDLIVFALNTLTTEFGRYAAQKAGLPWNGRIFDSQEREKLRALDLQGMINDLMRLLKEGIAAR
ncbi:MAG: TetR/AcrR family transcriptional regulator [Chloroflexota bacterium]|nr:MAG: TetR family transcriptional regulator [Bellilinea sp.]